MFSIWVISRHSTVQRVVTGAGPSWSVIVTRQHNHRLSLVTWSLTSHSTHYRSFWGQFLQARWPNQQCQRLKHRRKPVGCRDQAWMSPEPLHHVTIIQLYTLRKGPNVTNPICLTCKNCSYKCVADWTLYHTIQHRAVLIISPQPPDNHHNWDAV